MRTVGYLFALSAVLSLVTACGGGGGSSSSGGGSGGNAPPAAVAPPSTPGSPSTPTPPDPTPPPAPPPSSGTPGGSGGSPTTPPADPSTPTTPTTPEIVFETGFVLDTGEVSDWIAVLLAFLGAGDLDEAGASFTVWDNVSVETGEAITRSVEILVWLTVEGVTVTPISYYTEYSIATGEIIETAVTGVPSPIYSGYWDDEYPLLTDVGGTLWGITLDLDLYWGWWVDVVVNLLDAAGTAAIYLRSELDLVIDVSELLLGIEDVIEINTEFNAKPIQLRARLNLDLVLGVYFKLYYDLPMYLDIDIDVLGGTTSIDVFEEEWNFSWLLFQRQIAPWF